MTILAGQHRIQFGTSTIEYELVYSERKTLALHVYPDGSVVVDAPLGTELPSVEAKVQKRSAWILRQQRQFQGYARVVSVPRRYVSGEAYRYLGRQYRLKLVEDEIERVRLSRGYLTVSARHPSEKNHVGELINAWYQSHARRVFAERLAQCYPRVEPLGIMYPQLVIRDMKARWGSCSEAGRITLNVRLVQVSKDLIDYVVLHELCHLKEHNHSASFYGLLDRVLPDWRIKRERLNKIEIS
jgi:predicted metal-dependent hydrolase